MPVISHPPVVQRPFVGHDAGLVQTAASDPLIPLITTVPGSGDPSAARAYIARQNDRLASGEGCSFAIADAVTGGAIGQIGLWLRNLDHGRASTGYWVADQFRHRGPCRHLAPGHVHVQPAPARSRCRRLTQPGTSFQVRGSQRTAPDNRPAFAAQQRAPARRRAASPHGTARTARISADVARLLAGRSGCARTGRSVEWTTYMYGSRAAGFGAQRDSPGCARPAS